MNLNILECTAVAHLEGVIAPEDCQYFSQMLKQASLTLPSKPLSNPGCWMGNPQFSPEDDQKILELMTSICNEYITSLPQPIRQHRGIEETPAEWKFNAWANVNLPLSSNQVHVHTKSMITGVIYFQSTGTGSIRFHPYNYLMKLTKDHWPYQGDCSYAPNDGDILVFPSYLMHTVETNLHPTKDRICVAFDAILV